MTRVRRRPESHGGGLEASHVLGGRPDDAWELLVDTHRWADWSPTITAVVASERRIGPDTTGRVRLVGGPWVPFGVTDYDHEGRRWEWRVAGVPSTGHRVDALGDDRCRIAFELPTAAVGYLPVCLCALEAIEAELGSST